MKRNTQNVILIVLLAIFCLCILTACNRGSSADYFTYSEESLGLVGKLVRLMHGWIGNYGWTVVVFTVFLKIAMTPLDIWQRVSSRKSTLRMQKMQPIMAEIDKRYGANTPRANEEKQKLYKKQGFSAFAMCLPMIITMVVFFVMFGGLNDYSTHSTVTNFQRLSGTYFDEYYKLVKADGYDTLELTYKKDGQTVTATFHDSIASLLDDATDFDTNENFLRDNYSAKNVDAYMTAIEWLSDSETVNHLDSETCLSYAQNALTAVGEYYENNHESWLWIQNVWQPDTWAPIMPEFDSGTNAFTTKVGISKDEVWRDHYNAIRGAVVQTGGYSKNGSWNGLMILPILSIALSFLSIFLSQRLDRRVRKGEQQPATEQSAQQAASNKMMMIMMPLMMAFFGFMYTGAFAIYMVCNYLWSLIATLCLAYPVEKIVQRSFAKKEAQEKSNKANYMR